MYGIGIYLHENTLKSTNHVGKYTLGPMDLMGSYMLLTQDTARIFMDTYGFWANCLKIPRPDP